MSLPLQIFITILGYVIGYSINVRNGHIGMVKSDRYTIALGLLLAYIALLWWVWF